ncbi:MAG: NAD(P)-binding protein [Ramlibacter sp.]|nr:NAD(P)-binding protein [Ramlibacter sp.]
MNLFVTGASGYIGGTVAARMLAAGHSIRGLVRDAAKGELLEAAGIRPVLGDLDDTAVLTREAGRADGVINTANADHAASVRALIAALAGSGKALIHTTGSSVVGDDAHGESLSEAIFDEDTPFTVAPMKQARRNLDLEVLAAASRGVRGIVICPSLVYGVGRGLNPSSIQIPFLVDQARQHGAVRIVGTGVNRWSNVHIDDLADLYLLALERAPAGALYFAENGEASFAEIGAAIAARLRFGPVESVPAATAAEAWGAARAYYTFGSNSRVRAKRARRELGWTPHQASAVEWILNEMKL